MTDDQIHIVSAAIDAYNAAPIGVESLPDRVLVFADLEALQAVLILAAAARPMLLEIARLRGYEVTEITLQ